MIWLKRYKIKVTLGALKFLKKEKFSENTQWCYDKVRSRIISLLKYNLPIKGVYNK